LLGLRNFADVPDLRQGFIDWVVRYEELYYQHDMDRLATCPLTVHALLHIADGIEWLGPVWVGWAYPTERACGCIQRAVKGRRFLYSSIDKYVLQESQLSMVKLKYPEMREKLELGGKKPEVGVAVGEYKDEFKRLLAGSPCKVEALDSSREWWLRRALYT
jgi:hypothetical protein